MWLFCPPYTTAYRYLVLIYMGISNFDCQISAFSSYDCQISVTFKLWLSDICNFQTFIVRYLKLSNCDYQISGTFKLWLSVIWNFQTFIVIHLKLSDFDCQIFGTVYQSFKIPNILQSKLNFDCKKSVVFKF